jgi:hypothetical protein
MGDEYDSRTFLPFNRLLAASLMQDDLPVYWIALREQEAY